MTESELKEALQAIYDDQFIGISVYAIIKGSQFKSPVKLDIEDSAQAGLKDMFIGSLREKISNRHSLSVMNLSSSDERVDAIYVYDLDIPDELSSLETVATQDNIPLLSVSDQSFFEIKALLIEIGNNSHQVVLYKTLAPVNVFGKSGGVFLKKSSTRLEKIDGEFLRVSSGFQMLRVNGVLLVMDLEALEKSFGFHDVIKREAASGLRAIKTSAILENPDVLEELLDNIKYARKLTKVGKSSPVISAGISNQDVIDFCRSFPSLAGKIRFNAAQDKIVLDTNVSKDLFIKLLMDDFLTSQLTNFNYASLAKDKVDPETEGSS